MRGHLQSVVGPAVFTLAVVLGADRPAVAATIYVDSLQGTDAFDGSTTTPFDADSGPVRTIRRALELARFGDTIVLKNNGRPYYESLQLVGRRHSGNRTVNFTIIGNGAVISGLRKVPSHAWRKLGNNLWKMTPRRKGHYQILLAGKLVSEHHVPAGAARLPKIPTGHWAAWRGSVYLQAARLDEPPDMPFQFAYGSVGLTLYRVHDVRIVDLTFRHFRLDGINAHDACRDIELLNVRCYENGRAGLAVGGSSEVTIRDSRLENNRIDQLRISELGLVEAEKTEMSAPPTIVK